MRLVLALCLFAASVFGQQTTGAIRGAITDPSGAIVVGVSVVATNNATGTEFHTVSDGTGLYSLPLLPPGTYTASAEMPGFRKVSQENVLVRITETEVVNFALQVGAVADTVTVNTEVSLVQTDTSSEGKVIERATISALPLSTRNFTQLLGLTAGVLTEPFNAENIGFGTQNPNVNGMRKGSNNYLLDGVVNNNPMNNAVEGVGTPSVDFLQEFKVITNMYSAEYGRNAGSIVNVVTRSGSNDFHGNFFEFLRNTKLVARPFFAPQRGQNVQNQFGATIGGPVTIPKIYRGRDRTFFFFGYEGLRQRNTNSNAAIVIGRVPTPAERQGVFTSPVTDPTTGQPFPNNTVPQSRFHPTSAVLLEQYVPLPNSADPRNNFVQQFGTPFNGDQFTYRIDHEVSAKDRISFRQFNLYADQFAASGRLPGFGRVSEFTMRQLSLSETHLFRPNLVNEFRFGYYNFPSSATDTNTIDPRSVGIEPMNTLPGLPGIQVTGFLPYGYTGNDWKDQISSFLFNDTLSHIKGAHSLKYGAEVRYGQEQSFGVPFQGRFAFNGQYTGNALVDFLLAAPNQVTVANGPGKVDMRDWNFNFFVLDDWKVTSRLTLNMGLRYEYNRPLTETVLGQLLNFYPERYQGAGEESGLVIGGHSAGVPPSTVFPDKNNFAPRFGFAYALGSQSRTVIRGGFGIFYDTRTGQITQQKLFEPPYSANQSALFRPTDAPNGYRFPAPIDLSQPTVTRPGGNLTIRPIEKQTRTDYVEQWNFGIQHQLSNGLTFTTAYVGTHGLQLFRARNINYPILIDGRLRRPYDGFSTIMLQESGSTSIFHSFQLTTQKRFSTGSSFLAAYTLGKAIDDAASSSTRYYTNATGDPQDLRGSRGLADFDRTQRLVISYNQEIPNPFGANAKGFGTVFGGWELSGVTTLQSGTPFSVTNVESNLDHDGQAGAPGSGGRADAVIGVEPIHPGPHSGKLNDYLNPAAFAPAPRSRFGTLGRNTMRGPGSNLWDIRVSKVTPFQERWRLRFITEFFNAWNHPSFGNPATVLNTPTFGTIRSTLSNARIIQFALKLEY